MRSPLLSLLVLSRCLLFVSSRSDNPSYVAFCIARCPDVSCRSTCEQSAMEMTAIPCTNRTSESEPRLQCRDVNRLVLQHSAGIFLIEHRAEDGEWQAPIMSENATYVFRSLIPGKRYRFRLRRVSADGTGLPETTPWFETNEVNYVPKAIESASIGRIVASSSESRQLETYLNVKPADDLNCRYSVVHWGQEHSLFHYELDATSEYRLKLEHMKYDSENVVHVISRNEVGAQQSANVSLTFRTPSCLELHRNLTICAPAPVTGLRFTGTVVTNGSMDLKVSWTRSELQPDNYTVIALPLDSESSDGAIEVTVPGNHSTASLQNLVASYRYKVGVLAESKGGMSLKWEVTTVPIDSNWEKTSPIITAATTLTSLVLCLAFVYALHRRKRQLKDGTTCRYAFSKISRNALDEVKSPLKSADSKLRESNEDNDNRYEIQAERLLIKQELGSGIGGIVKLASLKNHQNQTIPVAVKMLRENATSEERRDFYREIALMKSTRNHENIVSLVGCCIFDKQPLLIVEYCSEGDLQTYLRKFFQEIVDAISRSIKCFSRTTYDTRQGNRMTNNLLYDIDTAAVASNRLRADDLLNFGRQVATGMEFLSLNRIIHRDLAARNVLVCADKTVKISDFGLSRDIYQENIYKKQSDGKLPLKWMAIEALTHRIYTTQSDVWSFGVLLYEIVTIGGDPYPSIQSHRILPLLKTGYRMERPANCGFELYEIMRSCWYENPKDRPSFGQLKRRLAALNNPRNNYLNLSEISNRSICHQHFVGEDTLQS